MRNDMVFLYFIEGVEEDFTEVWAMTKKFFEQDSPTGEEQVRQMVDQTAEQRHAATTQHQTDEQTEAAMPSWAGATCIGDSRPEEATRVAEEKKEQKRKAAEENAKRLQAEQEAKRVAQEDEEKRKAEAEAEEKKRTAAEEAAKKEKKKKTPLQEALSSAKLTLQMHGAVTSAATTLTSTIAKADEKWSFANSPEYLRAFTKANDKLKRTMDEHAVFSDFLTCRDLSELQAKAKKDDALDQFKKDLQDFSKLVNPRLEEIQLETRLLHSTMLAREEEKKKAAAAKQDKKDKPPMKKAKKQKKEGEGNS